MDSLALLLLYSVLIVIVSLLGGSLPLVGKWDTMLVLLAVFALALLALGGAFSSQSERLVELVSAEVP